MRAHLYAENGDHFGWCDLDLDKPPRIIRVVKTDWHCFFGGRYFRYSGYFEGVESADDQFWQYTEATPVEVEVRKDR